VSVYYAERSKSCEDQHLDIRLDIVGWGPLENELRQQYGDCKSILFHGALFGDQKNQFLRECDVLVVPSTAPEVFGIVITEAYAFGKPVIASRVGGIPEIVDDGRTGFLIEPGSVQELVEIITSVSKQPGILENMHLECFQMAYSFSLDTFIDNYQEQYRLLDNKA
jgi:glycosyltransferase involved in cell wall biosynthesis